MKNTARVFVSTLDRHYGTELDKRSESFPAGFAPPSYPTASLFLVLGMTKSTGEKGGSRKASVALSLPFEQGHHEEAYETAYRWVNERLVAAYKGGWSFFETPQNPLPVVPVQVVPSGAKPLVSVSFMDGATIPLGDFQFSTVELSMTALADMDRADEAQQFVVDFVREKVAAMEAKVLAYLKSRK